MNKRTYAAGGRRSQIWSCPRVSDEHRKAQPKHSPLRVFATILVDNGIVANLELLGLESNDVVTRMNDQFSLQLGHHACTS